MQLPVLAGIYTDNQPDFRVGYPINLIPVTFPTGISNGYLRPSEGLISAGVLSGADRGAIEWLGTHYRLIGTNFVSIDQNGVINIIGTIPGSDQVTFDYSFDRLAIAANNQLWYYDGSALSRVTDPDLGVVIDVVWVDGYFMTTDGEFLVVTELNDPTAVNPLKYGSSEIDPDPVVAIKKIRNEIYAINRNTIEVFDNVGGTLFPFQRIDGAQIMKGAVGTHACCLYIDALAFLGSGRNEQPGIYLGANAQAIKISTREIDTVLLNYTETELANVLLEQRTDKDQALLYVHLPDRTYVYDGAGSRAMGQQVWYVLTSSLTGFSEYRARNFVWVYGKHWCADPTTGNYGYVSDSVSTHWGDKVRWECTTGLVYNESNGAVFHELELVGLTGRVALGDNPVISTSYSLDGVTYSQEHTISAGTIGDRNKRLVWRRQGKMRNWRVQRFTGNSDAHIGIVRIEAKIEGLAY